MTEREMTHRLASLLLQMLGVVYLSITLVVVRQTVQLGAVA